VSLLELPKFLKYDVVPAELFLMEPFFVPPFCRNLGNYEHDFPFLSDPLENCTVTTLRRRVYLHQTCKYNSNNNIHSITMWILPLVGYIGLGLGFGFLTLAIGMFVSLSGLMIRFEAYQVNSFWALLPFRTG
jgi:hypothetical protein